MNYKLISLITYAVVVLLCLIFCRHGWRAMKVITKILLVPALAFLVFSFNSTVQTPVLCAFLLCFTGNILALLPGRVIFALRQVAFEFAFVCYGLYLYMNSDLELDNTLMLITLGCAAFVPVIVYLFNVRFIPFGLKISSFVFLGVTAAFTTLCFCVFLNGISVMTSLIAASSVFFTVAVCVDGVDEFRWEKEEKQVNFITVFAYIAAQTLFCAAILGG